MEPRFFSLPACSLVAIPAELSRLLHIQRILLNNYRFVIIIIIIIIIIITEQVG
jgi:hypothetical protein